MLKSIGGLFLVFWGLVKIFQGWILFDGGDSGVLVMVLGAIAIIIGIVLIKEWVNV